MIEKSNQNYDKLYAAIGKFCVEFEQLCFEIQNTIMTILDREGLQNKSVLRILLAGDTADPLRMKLVALLPQTVELNDNEKKIAKNIFARVQNLIKSRNDVLHATWFIGWISEPFELANSARGHKYDKGTEGEKTKEFNYKTEDFDKFTKEATNLKSLIIRLKGCLSADYSIEKNFRFIGKEVVPTEMINK